MFPRPRRIETELSRDVLNPARVTLSWANSPTLGTYSSPRMRRADIEVPNLAVDVTPCNSLQRRLYLYLFRDSGVSWKSWIWPQAAWTSIPRKKQEVVTGEACRACLEQFQT